MSTDSHSAMAAKIARYRKALRAIAALESLPIGDQGEEMGSRLMAARLASAALADGGEAGEPALAVAARLAYTTLQGAALHHSRGCAAVLTGKECDCWLMDRRAALEALREAF